MVNISSFSKNIYQKLKQEYCNPSSMILVALLCIPLNYAFNTISLVLLTLITLITFKKDNLKFEINLILPILLYLLMLLSITWTIDFDRTLDALSKELPLLLIPICFLLFRSLTTLEKDKIIKWYSYGIVTYSIFYLTKAVIRYTISNDSSVFFYHELVTKDVNAIHVSVYIAISFFYFLVKTQKTTFDKCALGILFLMVCLLSSKNIIVVFIALLVSYQLFYSKTSKKLRLKNLILLIVILLSLPFVGEIKERFKEEYETIMTDSSINDVVSKGNGTVYNISIKQAWNNTVFKQNDYLPGTAFRVYQFRIFTEMLHENVIFWNGFGLDASYSKINEKGIQYNLFLGDDTHEGYQKKNFHNQYIQVFAELGIFGLLLLLTMLFISFRNAIHSKNFVQIAFSLLMLSLFLTESFLWRQRGITFFILMYCIFNANLKSEKTISI
jgi:O-antigen ligase